MAGIFDPAVFDPAIFDADVPVVATAPAASAGRYAPQRRQGVTISGHITIGTLGLSARIGVVPDEDWLLDLGPPN